MAIELLVFDWDGTLMDSEGKIVTCFERAIDDLGLEPRDREALRSTIGLGLAQAMHQLFPCHDDQLNSELVARYRHWFLNAADLPVSLFPGVERVLEELEERGFWLAVATGKSAAGLARDLDRTGLLGRFHATRCADQASSKPHPQMLLEIMHELNVEKTDTIMIGDTTYDMEMARNAGAHRVAVTYGAHAHERLLEFDPLHMLDSLEHLPSLIHQFTRTDETN